MLGLFPILLNRSSRVFINALILFFVCLATVLPASAEERILERFEIETTNNNSIKVILYTDGRTAYHTEPQDKGFSLILDNARLSDVSRKSGLPVVIDNKNRFIGRAVPEGDGQIKIIIPNLPTDQYAVSVIQRNTLTQLDPKPKSSVQPFKPTASNETFDDPFEEIVSQFEKPEPSKKWAHQKKPDIISATGTTQPIKKPRSVYYPPTTASPNPASQPMPPRYYFPQWQPQRSTLNTSPSKKSPSNWVSVTPVENYGAMALEDEESKDLLEEVLTNDSGEISSIPLPTSQLGYRQLDPGFTESPTTEMEVDPLLSANSPAASKSGFVHSLFSWINRDIAGFPLWGVVLASFFLGGIGLFALMGALLLARLFINPKLLTQTAPVIEPAQTASHPTFQDPFYADKMAELEEKAPLVPEEMVPSHTIDDDPVIFPDQAMVNATDYLIHSPNSVQEAIRNTTLLKISG